jgi:hypothetical protein
MEDSLKKQVCLDEREPGQLGGSGHGWTWALWILFVLLVGYPLSVGPAAKLYFKNLLPHRPVEVFYAPLEAVAKNVPGANRFFEWYIDDVWKATPRSAPLVTPPPIN